MFYHTVRTIRNSSSNCTNQDHICINSLVPIVLKTNIGNPGNQVNYWGGLTPPPPRAVIDIADIDISIKMSCDIDIDIENADIDISAFGVTSVVELASLTRKHEKALIILRPCKLL